MELKLKKELTEITYLESVNGDFGWKILGILESDYLSYNEIRRKLVESNYSLMINERLEVKEIDRIRMLFLLIDDVYYWLFTEKILDKEVKLKCLDKRLNELLDNYEDSSYFKDVEERPKRIFSNSK